MGDSAGVGTGCAQARGRGNLNRRELDRWSCNSQRVERLKLVVQNRSYLLLAECGQTWPARSWRRLAWAFPGQWKENFGQEPLLSESFSDQDTFNGTYYPAILGGTLLSLKSTLGKTATRRWAQPEPRQLVRGRKPQPLQRHAG